jgi:acetylornithine deacetylase/succinyl-diaminopimelate desuccinylase-like protein
VRTGRRDLHSGVYGGAALNAVHVLVDALARVTPRAGRVPPSLLTDVLEPEPDELDSWSALPPGGDLLDEEGAAQADAQAGVEFYLRTWALPSLDVNGVEGGSPVQQKTIVPSAARANLTLRLARGQTAKRLAPIVEAELRRGLPASADLAFTVLAACDPGRLAADSTATRLALDAFARALGRRPLVLPSGGSLPIVPLLERLAIPAVITGFNTPSDNVHAPNERMRLSNLALALAAARETFLALAALPLHNPQPDSGVRPSD